MKVESFKIAGPLLLTPQKHRDERGFFMEAFNLAEVQKALGASVNFVQDNQSLSMGQVLRGIHYQLSPRAQGKLVRCLRGRIFDVAVDLRKSSPNFGKWVGAELTEDSSQMLWIPEGFGHAFATLTDATEVLYKTTDYYSKEHDRSLLWSDPEIGIEWPFSKTPTLSAKDSAAPTLALAQLFN